MQNLTQKTYLPFESPIQDIDNEIKELNKISSTKGIDYAEDIRKLRKKRIETLREIYSNLSAWQTVQVARHQQRPGLQDYLKEGVVVTDFKELHGDKLSGDDRTIITGFGQINHEKVMIIGQDKTQNHGMAHPESYRKAHHKMKLAEKYSVPIVSFIDTPGAFPGIEAEERGQAYAIAQNLKLMSRLRTPMISIIIGQGGSGGAEGIKGQDNVAMLKFAYYSVISPEGCAAILGKGEWDQKDSAESLKLTSEDALELKIIDNIIPEPLGGAHQNASNCTTTSNNVKTYLNKTLRQLKRIPLDDLLEKRYKKLRNFGTEYAKIK